MTRLTRRLATLLIVLLPALAIADARSPEIYTDMHGRALKGHDAVAYHLERRPVKGSEEFALDWKGARWLFASAENRDRFAAEPERWAPQYGGYCAWGIAKDRPVGIDPTIFRIFDGKLYLNLNIKVHKEWLANRHGFIAQANEKWPAVLELKR